MFRYVVRRLLQMILAFLGTTLIVYGLVFLGQTDPVQALYGEKPVPPSVRVELTQQFHLDQPFIVQYGYYLENLATGNLGNTTSGQPISDILAQAYPATIQLALIAMTFVIVFGVTGGIVAGVRRNGWFDRASLLFTLVVIGIPIIVLGFVAQYYLCVKLGWFPVTASGAQTWSERWWPFLLPGLILGALSLATAMRLTRASVAENLSADYVRTANAKGLSRRRVIGVHVLRNSLIPIITFLGVELGNLMSGAIVTESIYQVPGIGFQLKRAIDVQDGATVVTIVSVLVVIYLITNLIVDIMYAVLDPRIRYQ